MDNRRTLALLAFLGSFFAFGVIGLGAFTRLVNAGLGCPDWPGCYGHLGVPMTESAKLLAQLHYPDWHLESYKAWAEMIHRYFVGGLSLFLLSIVSFIFMKRDLRTRNNCFLACALVSLLVYQILLGKYTVTYKLLPIVVTQHLLGGFFILATLWLTHLNNHDALLLKLNYTLKHKFQLVVGAVISLIILLLQIALGAWTSTHYASLSCTSFPFCMSDHSFIFSFKEAFNYAAPIGINYEGGVLSEAARQTIHMSHRAGAMVLTLFLFCYLVFALPKIKHAFELIKSLYVILALLFVQLCLGIANVMFKLPLANAISHNLIAVLLLLAMITFIFKLTVCKPKRSKCD